MVMLAFFGIVRVWLRIFGEQEELISSVLCLFGFCGFIDMSTSDNKWLKCVGWIISLSEYEQRAPGSGTEKMN